MTTDKQRFRIELTGRVPHAIVNEITRRFGPPSVEFLQPVTVMTTATLDQSSLRALLDLLWDGGGDIRSISQSSHPPRKDRR
jgi:uncharacterized protein (DUF1810 family)